MFRSEPGDDDDNIILLGGGTLRPGSSSNPFPPLRLQDDDDLHPPNSGIPDLDSDPWERTGNPFPAPQRYDFGSAASAWNQVASVNNSSAPFNSINNFSNSNTRVGGLGSNPHFDGKPKPSGFEEDDSSLEPSFGAGQPNISMPQTAPRPSNDSAASSPPLPTTGSAITHKQQQPVPTVPFKLPSPKNSSRTSSTSATGQSTSSATGKVKPTVHFSRVASNTFAAVSNFMNTSKTSGTSGGRRGSTSSNSSSSGAAGRVFGADQMRTPLLDDDDLEEDEVGPSMRRRQQENQALREVGDREVDTSEAPDMVATCAHYQLDLSQSTMHQGESNDISTSQ
ncbi:hypothetical protein HDU67_000417 [Dinochytrium kinnereticum]|nr:hypothetical protein HDU67_000417 [Dinochytrium kinnereticum]